MIIPILPANGIYTGNISYMFSDMGVQMEDLLFANYASTVGMILSYGILGKVMQHFRGKELLIGSLLIVAGLSMSLSQSDSPLLIIVFSFLIGFFKMFAMIKLIVPLMFVISPTGDRATFYAVFYPIAIGLGQLSAYLFSLLAYQIDWRVTYAVMAMALLACSLLCIVLMHNKRGGRRQPLAGIDWLSMLLLGGAFLLLDFILVYSKVLGWFSSPSIQYAVIAFFACTGWFIRRQLRADKPYIPMKLFATRNVSTGMLITFLLGLFLASGSVQTVFTSILGYDNTTVALLNLAMLPGIIAGGFISYFWRKKNWSMKSLLFIAFLCFQGYSFILYFTIAPVIEIERLIFPMILKGLGMCLVFIGASLYLVNKLTRDELLPVLSIFIGVRTFLATAFFGAVISWALYKLQLQEYVNLTSKMDAADPLLNGGVALYGNVKVQAALSSAKKLFGYILIAGTLILVFILLHPFEAMHRRKLILVRKRFRGDSLTGYRRAGTYTPEVSPAEAVSPASGV